MKKLTNHSGETLVETLVSLIIITLVFIFLASSIVASAKVNASADQSQTTFKTGSPADTAYKVTILCGGEPITQNTATLYETENGYYYYESSK